jgi:hypothetical protein
MMTIDECVNVLRTNSVRSADIPSSVGLPPMVFASSTAGGSATAEECDAVAFGHCPPDLKEFWRLTRSAKLFVDITTGQWGIEILSPDEAATETNEYHRVRARDALKGDLIVGRFLGDSQLLLVRCDKEAYDFGSVIVVGPIDRRVDWGFVAASLQEFLNRYIDTRGEMFWTHTPDSS